MLLAVLWSSCLPCDVLLLWEWPVGHRASSGTTWALCTEVWDWHGSTVWGRGRWGCTMIKEEEGGIVGEVFEDVAGPRRKKKNNSWATQNAVNLFKATLSSSPIHLQLEYLYTAILWDRLSNSYIFLEERTKLPVGSLAGHFTVGVVGDCGITAARPLAWHSDAQTSNHHISISWCQ